MIVLAKCFFAVRDKLNDEQRSNFCMLLWSIWRKRNDKVWENKDCGFKEVVYRAKESLQMWRWARNSYNIVHANTQLAIPTAWESSVKGTLKCNMDAAFWDPLGVTGCGMCLKDHHGSFFCCSL